VCVCVCVCVMTDLRCTVATLCLVAKSCKGGAHFIACRAVLRNETPTCKRKIYEPLLKLDQ
jgi:hypothetical protein